jgi:hypothetical protein
MVFRSKVAQEKQENWLWMFARLLPGVVHDLLLPEYTASSKSLARLPTGPTSEGQ